MKEDKMFSVSRPDGKGFKRDSASFQSPSGPMKIMNRSVGNPLGASGSEVTPPGTRLRVPGSRGSLKSSDVPVRQPVQKLGGQLKAMGKMVGQRAGKSVGGAVISGINKVSAGMNMAKEKMQKAKDMAGPRLKKLAAADDFEPTKGRF